MGQQELTIDPKRLPDYHREQKRLFAQAFGAAAREHPDAMHGVNKERFAKLLESDSRYRPYLDTYEEALFELNAKYIGGQGSGVGGQDDDDRGSGVRGQDTQCVSEDAESASCEVADTVEKESDHVTKEEATAADNNSESKSLPTANSQEPTAAVSPTAVRLPWMDITGTTTFDPARIDHNKRKEGLHKLKQHVYHWLKEKALYFEPPGADSTSAWDQIPRNEEPSAELASELQMSETKLNALMREASGMSARQLWDYLRLDEALMAIRDANNKFMKLSVGLRGEYSFTSDHLRKMKRSECITNADYATWCGFKNLARLNVACLNKYNRSLQGVLMERIKEECLSIRSWVFETLAKVRTKCTHFSDEHQQILEDLTPKKLAEWSQNIDVLIEEVEKRYQKWREQFNCQLRSR